MKVVSSAEIGNIPTEDGSEDLKRFLQQILVQIRDAINGRISFQDNLEVTLPTVTFPAANTDVVVPHSLNRLPGGYLVATNSTGIIVRDGSGSNTTSTLVVQSNGAGTVKLVIF